MQPSLFQIVLVEGKNSRPHHLRRSITKPFCCACYVNRKYVLANVNAIPKTNMNKSILAAN